MEHVVLQGFTVLGISIPKLSRELGINSISSPLGMTKLMGDGQAASMKSQRRGVNKCLAGSSCFRLEIQRDMGRS